MLCCHMGCKLIIQTRRLRRENGNKLTKKAMCDLVVPFRDKYKLTDLQALMVARNELSISEIADLLSN